MVTPDRLIPPDDEPATSFSFTTGGEPILVTDATYIADYFNESDPHSRFIRATGVVLSNFGGDTPCQLWWQPPHLIAVTSSHYGIDPEPPTGVTVLSSNIAIDSGHLLFLPLGPSVPADLQPLIAEATAKFGASQIELPSGIWHFYYEQFPSPTPEDSQFYRNIVAIHEPGIA